MHVSLSRLRLMETVHTIKNCFLCNFVARCVLELRVQLHLQRPLPKFLRVGCTSRSCFLVELRFIISTVSPMDTIRVVWQSVWILFARSWPPASFSHQFQALRVFDTPPCQELSQ